MRKIKALLEEYENVPEFFGMKDLSVNSVSIIGDTPIFVAIVNGEIEDVKLLIKNGADINFVGDEGYTPLMEAIEFQQYQIALYLINCGANVHLKNVMGLSALDIAKLEHGLDVKEVVEAINANM